MSCVPRTTVGSRRHPAALVLSHKPPVYTRLSICARTTTGFAQRTALATFYSWCSRPQSQLLSPKSRRIPGSTARSFSRLEDSFDLTIPFVAATTIVRWSNSDLGRIAHPIVVRSDAVGPADDLQPSILGFEACA
jgi:hypothetical protein